jgi:hypothetical protein
MLAALKWSIQEALLSSVETRLRAKARRFLDGLSLDELKQIASFSGACALESFTVGRCTREQLAELVWRFGVLAGVEDSTLLLVFEYFCRYGGMR